jgi:hypothetical protein
VALPRRRRNRFGDRGYDNGRGRRIGFGGEAVEEGRTFDPLTAAAEGHLHQAVDVGLLGVDLLTKFGHHAAEFGDHRLGMGQLPAKLVDVVGRRQAESNPAGRSR